MEESKQNDGDKGKKSPELAFALAWALPGLGHFYLGQRAKAAFFFVVLTITFFVGFTLCEFGEVAAYETGLNSQGKVADVFRPSFLAQAGMGIVAIVPAGLTKFKIHREVERELEDLRERLREIDKLMVKLEKGTAKKEKVKELKSRWTKLKEFQAKVDRIDKKIESLPESYERKRLKDELEQVENQLVQELGIYRAELSPQIQKVEKEISQWMSGEATKKNLEKLPEEKAKITAMIEVDPKFSLGLLYMMVAGLLNYLVAQSAFEKAVRLNEPST